MKQAFANTICDDCTWLPDGLRGCDSYGMTWGCDKGCPTFWEGKCPVYKECLSSDRFMNDLSEDDKQEAIDLYSSKHDKEVTNA